MNKILHVQVKTFITCSEAEKKIMLAKKTRNVFEIKKKDSKCEMFCSHMKTVFRRLPSFGFKLQARQSKQVEALS